MFGGRPVVDSARTEAEAIRQNPANKAPPEIIRAQRVLPVSYYGFDGALHEGQMVVHEEAVSDVRAFFALARELEFPIAKVIPISDARYAWDDDRSCADNNTSGFNYRLVTGSGSRPSNHAFGRAFDVNPLQNPYIRYDAEGNELFRIPVQGRHDESAPGTLTRGHPLVMLMNKRGWKWGGSWTPRGGPVDYQHFEKPA